jgi:hypothetical protein
MSLIPAVGGPTPLPDHHVLTLIGPTDVGPGCENEAATTYAPLQAWEPLTFVGYQASRAADGVAPEAFALHKVTGPSAPVGAILVNLCELGCGGHTVIPVCYSGTAPAIDSQVVSDGDGCVRSATTGETGIGRVMKIIDAATDGTTRLELLI